MTANEYVKSKGLVPAIVSQKMGVSRQCLGQYGNGRNPTAKTLERLAEAMTELGVTTTVLDLVAAIYPAENKKAE